MQTLIVFSTNQNAEFARSLPESSAISKWKSSLNREDAKSAKLNKVFSLALPVTIVPEAKLTGRASVAIFACCAVKKRPGSPKACRILVLKDNFPLQRRRLGSLQEER